MKIVMIASTGVIAAVIVQEEHMKIVTERLAKEEQNAKKEIAHARIISHVQRELCRLSEVIILTDAMTEVMTTIITDVREIMTGVTDIVKPVVVKRIKFGAFFL